jgi:hypothetical protein
MKKPTITAMAAAAAMFVAPPLITHAGKTVKEPEPPAAPAKTLVEEEASGSIFPSWPAGSITLGAEFSEHATGGYVDSVTGLWTSGDRESFLFFNSRYHLEDNDQFISSSGLGFRQMILDGNAIIGGNVYWDSIHSAENNDFDQFGFGVELLTKWVDARFNYYLPEDDRYEIGRTSRSQTTHSVSAAGIGETTTTSHFRRYESGLEGYNAEVGFLVPGLDRYADVRLYAGYYHYDNPFGDDFEGFKARMEARVLQGVTFDLEYWDDEELNGGHWTGGVRVSLPFTFANVFRGRNPFEGASETFKPYRRELKDRMGEMVIRSHRIQTVASDNILVDRTSDSSFIPVARPVSPGNPPPPSGGFPLE